MLILSAPPQLQENERIESWLKNTAPRNFPAGDPVDDLKTEEDIALYFQACVEEDPGDGKNSRLRLFIRL